MIKADMLSGGGIWKKVASYSVRGGDDQDQREGFRESSSIRTTMQRLTSQGRGETSEEVLKSAECSKEKKCFSK